MTFRGSDRGGDDTWRPNDDGNPPFGTRRPYEAYSPTQTFMRRPAWKRIAKRKDRHHPNSRAGLTQDGLSLMDWRSKMDDLAFHSDWHQITHVTIDMMEGVRTPDMSNVCVEWTPMSEATGRRLRSSPDDFIVVAWAPRLRGLPAGIYACADMENLYIVDGHRAQMVTKWAKTEMLKPALPGGAQGLKGKGGVSQHRLGFGKTPSAGQLAYLKSQDWAGVWWAPDCRALCCTAGCVATIVAFDQSLGP